MARRGFNGALMRAFTKDHTATVREVEHLAPHFVRIRFHSETLLDDVVLAPAVWLRFWFPGIDDPETEYQRAYTITEADPAAGTFAVDMVLHQPAGPASAWAQEAEVGQTIGVMSLGPSKFAVPPEPPQGYLLIGDSASIPAISSVIEALPRQVPIELYLEQHDPRDPQIPLPEHPRLTTHWVPRTDATSLAAAIEDRDWSDWYAWVTPESGSLKHLRARLKDDFGFPKSEIHPQAYWIEGRAMGKSRGDEAGKQATKPLDDASEGRTEPLDEARGAEVDGAQGADANGTEPLDGARGAGSDEARGTGTDEVRGAEAPAAARSTPKRGRWKASAGSRLLAPLKPTFIVAGVLQAIVTILELAPFVLMVELGRRLLLGAGTDQLWSIGVWALVLLGAGTLLASALMLWLHTVDARYSRALRQRLLGKLARLPLGWFTDRSSGQVKKQVQDDTLELHYLVTHAVPDAVAASVAPIAVLAYLFAVDWRLGLALFIPVLFYVLTMYLMVVQSMAQTAQALRWAEWIQTEAGTYLEAQPVIRVFGGGAQSRFADKLSEYIGFLLAWQRPYVGKKTLMDLATRPATFLLVIMAFGTPMAIRGTLSPVDLLPFLMLGTTFGARLLGVGYGLGGLRDGLAAARRIQTTLEDPELAEATEDTATALEPRAGVELDRVDFSYREGIPVIDQVSLALTPGTVTALVGASGSGKSTLAALVARFHDVDSGAIRIDGRDIRSMTPDELYSRVGFVFQQTQLVVGTVRDNIALAVPDATDQQVADAAKAAQIHDRICQLPLGYDTVLGPDAALSGGEKQRLSIARALLADTPILVLDEATALADPESEYLVQQAISRLTVGRTVLVIAHRLHTVVDADQIVVLDHGRVADIGTHTELLHGSVRYQQLWQAGSDTTDPTLAEVTP